jgi:DNA-directed RNA polymerase specialized sigma54-like protein
MSEYLQFVAVKDSSNSLVSLKKDLDETIEDILTDFLNHNFKRSKSAWTVKTAEIKDICEEIEGILATPESGTSSEEEEDDELIQEVLKRRFKNESSGKVIEDDKIVDSEDEDVISLARRIRHLYAKLSDKKK